MGILNSNHLAPSAGGYEPQRTANWALEIALDDAGDQNIILTGLDAFDGISESNDEIELMNGNEKRYVAGQATFEAAPLTLKDFVDIGVASAIIRWRRQVYNAETGSIGLAAEYKKNADLTLFGPNQETTRIWKLVGIWPQAVKYGSLDMTTSEMVKIEVTLRYDKAVPSTGLNGGLGGVNVGSTTIQI